MGILFSALASLLGGLAIFLLGMKHLSEGLQGVGGGGVRRFAALATSNKTAGVATGIAATLTVQSSSVVVAMLTGFAASGMMTLEQALNVVIGANIGTTGTVWIVAFAPSPLMVGLLAATIGGALAFFCEKERAREAGFALLGLGLVFLGLYYMARGVQPVRDNPSAAQFFARMDASSLSGAAITAAVACVFTAVIQSSAATIAISMTLASQGVVTYEVALATLFGANIGTTATGWIASIGAGRVAKQTALCHTLSNLLGSIVLLPAFGLFVKLSQFAFPGWHDAETIVSAGRTIEIFPGMMAPIAFTDTVFSVLRGVLTLVFARPFLRLVRLILPLREGDAPHFCTLLSTALISPAMACEQAAAEVDFMRKSAFSTMELLRKAMGGEATADEEDRIKRHEDDLDIVQHDVTCYLSQMIAKRCPVAVADRARRLLRLADEYESISDEAAAALKALRRLRSNAPDAEYAKIFRSLHDMVDSYARGISPGEAASTGAIKEAVQEGRKFCLNRMNADDPASSLRTLAALDVLNTYRRMAGCWQNIAEQLTNN